MTDALTRTTEVRGGDDMGKKGKKKNKGGGGLPSGLFEAYASYKEEQDGVCMCVFVLV